MSPTLEASAISALGCSWFHNYNPTTNITPPAGAEYVPAFFNLAAVTAPNLAAATAAASQYILTFNEPDGNPPAGSAMTPTQALAVWHQFELTGKKLGAPATLNQTNGSWITQFMTGIVPETGLPPRVDFQVLHKYMAPGVGTATQRDSLLAYVNNVFAAWGQRIWVTEANVISFTGATPDLWTYGTQAEWIALLAQLRNYLSASGKVDRFCPYPLTILASLAAQAPNYLNIILCDRATAALTPCGIAYRDAIK